MITVGRPLVLKGSLMSFVFKTNPQDRRQDEGQGEDDGEEQEGGN